MDLGDAAGDGGGDMEISPLCLASWIYVTELHEEAAAACQPHQLPTAISSVRRAGLLMRSVFVLMANCDRGDGTGQWPLLGLALFLNRAVPTLQVASVQAPEAFARSSGPLCAWSPAGALRAVVEALTSTQDV